MVEFSLLLGCENISGKLTQDIFNKIYNDSVIAISFVDLSGQFIKFNDAFLKLTEYSRDELLANKKFQDITPDEYFDFEVGVVKEILSNENTVRYEKEFICKDGTILPVLINATCLRNNRREPYAFAATIQEISRYKTYQNELKDYKNKFLSLLDISNDVVCELNSEFRFLSLSPNSANILLYMPSELMGRNLFDYVHHDDFINVKSIFEKSIRNSTAAYFLFRFRSKEGQWLLKDCSIKPFEASTGETRLILNFKSISDKVELQNKVQKQGNELNLRVKDLNILYKVIEAVQQSLDLKEVYKIALDMIITLDNVDMVFLYLVDENRKESILETHRNVPESYIRRVTIIPRGIGLTWKIIETGKLVNVEDIQYNKDIGQGGKELGHHGLLGVPLSIGKKVIGVLYFASYKYHKFDQNEVSLFSSISDHLSEAISKANLYEELKESEKKYRDLYENVPTGLYCKSDDGHILMANSTLIQLLGFRSFDEMSSRYQIRSEFHAGRTGKSLKKLPKKRSKIMELESTWLKQDGSVINVIESVRKILDKNGNFLYYEGTVTDNTERKMVENKLKKSRESLRKLAERLELYREEERTAIAREIHDEFAQLLTGMTIDMAWLKKRLPMVMDPESGMDILEKIDNFSALVDDAFMVVKKICGKLRPSILDVMGIEAALKWQINSTKSQTDIDIKFNSSISGPLPDPKVSTAIFRIFQESLTNIIRHAQATKVLVSLEQSKNYMILSVKDNGKGITESSIYSMDSLGLLGIKERVHALGGDVQIKGVPGSGTILRVQIPFEGESK